MFVPTDATGSSAPTPPVVVTAAPAPKPPSTFSKLKAQLIVLLAEPQVHKAEAVFLRALAVALAAKLGIDLTGAAK